jgi:hypothetical protein
MSRFDFPRQYRAFEESLVAALSENSRELVTYLNGDMADKDFTASTYLPLAGGTMTGTLTLHGDPVNGLHATTKTYVDTLVGAIDLTPYLAKAGGTMAGIIAMGSHKITGLADPTTNTQDAATANWVEDTAKAYDAGLLDGHDSTYFATAGHGHTTLEGVYFSGSIAPDVTQGYSCGLSSAWWSYGRFHSLYYYHLYDASDERLKDNIRPFDFNPLQMVQRMRPVKFEFKGGEGTSHGLVAQDLQGLETEFGITGLVGADEGGMLAINLTAVVAVLIGAVKQLADWGGDHGR